METLWTAFLWGLGVSFGCSFGALWFAVVYGSVLILGRSKTYQSAQEVAELSLKALDRRNDLTVEQAALLERIASGVEGIERR